MDNKNIKRKKALINTVLIALVAGSVLTASIMSGCSSESKTETSETKVVSETQIVTEIIDVTDSQTESTSSEKSNEKNENSTSANSNSDSSSKTQNNSQSKTNNSDNNSSSSAQNNSNSSAQNNNSNSSAQNNNASSSSKTSSATNNSSKKPSSNNNSGSGVLTIDGNKYNVGDTFNCTVNITTPDKIENYQGTLKYDSSCLSVVDAELVSPASGGGVVNYSQSGKILFNGSSGVRGYNYKNGGEFLNITFKVKSAGSVTPSIDWVVARQLTKNGSGKNYADGGISTEIIYN